ncbi:MAG: NTP transferase domain-containing protein [Actinobacteria bacterium]|nr:NTP transferase domain-containing protein [Actinomycetota bacterium]
MTTIVRGDDEIGQVFDRLHQEGVGLAVVTADGDSAAPSILGTVTDAELRRAHLAGHPPTTEVARIVGDDPAIVASDASDDHVRAVLERHGASVVAVVDGGRVVGYRHLDDVGGHQPPVTAVILAGGRGQRLRPLTDKVPKPLLTVGRTTIVERLLEGLWAAGVKDVHLSVNYKAEAFEERLGDGEGYGVRLHYLREHIELNTAGPLSLLPERPVGPVLVMNADQVTALHFARLVDYHRHSAAAITVGAFDHAVQIPYGVLHLEGDQVAGIVEKPTLHRSCNAGIYVLEPHVIDLVPPETFFGMPTLVEAVLTRGERVTAFPILEKFIDIGTLEELEAALVLFATGEQV